MRNSPTRESGERAAGMEFRERDYEAEEIACCLPRETADDHPLAPSPSSSPEVVQGLKVCFDDPLRSSTKEATQDIMDSSRTLRSNLSSEVDNLPKKEWNFFKGSLTQKFSCSSIIAVSQVSDIIVSNSKGYKSLADVHREDLDHPEATLQEEKKEITKHEYIARLQELKGEISLAWRAEDCIKALKLSIKVARLLMDTSVVQFYPTLFSLVVDIMDMLGDLVWERIKKRAECADDGTSICCLRENFRSNDICCEAKETCFNWFCKLGSIHELLPRIYLELAILRCWRFLEDSFASIFERLVMMIRGLADPLQFAYCHLYLARCTRLLYYGDDGYLIVALGDLSILLRRIIFEKDADAHHFCKNKKVLISLMEPSIDWIIKCIFVNGYQNAAYVLAEFGVGKDLSVTNRKTPCVAIVLYHLLKQLPADVISDNAVQIIDFIEQNKDLSVESYLDYRLLGHKLCEKQHSITSVCSVISRIMQVLVQCKNISEYLIIADAYIDTILLYSNKNNLSIILDGIIKRSYTDKVDEVELDTLQSILVKIIFHLDNLEDMLATEHFMEIIELLYGSYRNTVYMNILQKAVRTGHIGDPTKIQFLFEVCEVLDENISIANTNDENKHKADLISKFVGMVSFGGEWERHLAFLCECRAAFGCINEVMNSLIHSSNNLAVQSIKENVKFPTFFKSCLAFSEVTIPSISDNIGRMTLFLETAEIALLGGLISHSEGLTTSAISCVQSLHTAEDQISSLTCKVCSLLLMIPGSYEDEMLHLVHNLISAIRCQSLASSTKVKIFCAIISLLASLSQNKLLYHARNTEITSNRLFFGDLSFYKELSSVANLSLQILDDAINQEPHLVARGKLALDTCNCLLVSFKINHELSLKCANLIDIATSCLHARERYLHSTIGFFDRLSANPKD